MLWCRVECSSLKLQRLSKEELTLAPWHILTCRFSCKVATIWLLGGSFQVCSYEEVSLVIAKFLDCSIKQLSAVGSFDAHSYHPCCTSKMQDVNHQVMMLLLVQDENSGSQIPKCWMQLRIVSTKLLPLHQWMMIPRLLPSCNHPLTFWFPTCY